MKNWDRILGGVLARIRMWMALAGLYPNMNRVTRSVWVGGVNYPELIRSKGFHAVLDLRMTVDVRYMSYLEDNGIEYLNIKIPDGRGASNDVLFRIVNWIEDKIGKEKKVLIHCNLGRGRAPFITTAYIVFKGSTLQEALKKVKVGRKVTFLNAVQRKGLQDFSNQIYSIRSTSNS